MDGEEGINRYTRDRLLYHGSDVRIEVPDLTMSEWGKDFGIGFYLTTDRKQATEWGKRKAREYKSLTHTPYVNIYYLTNFDGLRVREFQGTSIKWIDFILKNRKSNIAHTEYDVIMGKVADDNTREMIARYERGEFADLARYRGVSEKVILIEKLHPEKLKDQICICTEIAKQRIKFVKGSVCR